MMFLKSIARYDLAALIFILALFIPAATSSAQPEEPMILWDQMGTFQGAVVGSSNFTQASQELSVHAADDFQIIGSNKWVIQTVNVFGEYNVSDSADSINVIFFSNDEGIPGEPVQGCQYLNIQPEDITQGNFVINLPEACVLGPGIYWVSVQANFPDLDNLLWFWNTIDEEILDVYAFENPGGSSIPECSTWMPFFECTLDSGPGLSFQLLGGTMPIPIPTLNQWGLIAASVILGLIGLLYLTRRRTA